ncbi:MAG TPA: MmcQ/YjbR family DNA-binding protein [Gemmatimonadaceae bacterium]|nr:MmcQ/YjbR family DNA-binding protein [Gemmatimonadaceae bacterium]HPV74229.1 MmcQ/YjbR family DNA-binding protein [Gemmatimonadaceae bacterium]
MAPSPLTHDDVRRLARAFPEVHEGAHMGHADLRVRDKIFASFADDPAVVSVKIAPVNLDVLVRSDPETFRDVWGGRWVEVRLASVTRDTLRDLLEDAWRMTAPASLVNVTRSDTPSVAATSERSLSH